MKIFKHRYSLKAKGLLNSAEALANRLSAVDSKHEGFLFKIEFSPTNVGFSSIHLHPSLGDMTAPQFEKALQEGGVDFLLVQHSQIFLNAKIDADNLWQPYFKDSILSSHFTSINAKLDLVELEQLKVQGWTRIKVKVGTSASSFEELVEYYQKISIAYDFEWIFDFNFSGDLEMILKTLAKLKLKVFLEDPLEFELESWKKLIDQGALLFADQVDHSKVIKSGLAIKALVVKPTKVDMEKYFNEMGSMPWLFTSNMGEDLDLLTTIYWALRAKSQYPNNFMGAGFMTQNLFEKSKQLSVMQSLDISPESAQTKLKTLKEHWGKSHYLNSLDWTEV